MNNNTTRQAAQQVANQRSYMAMDSYTYSIPVLGLATANTGTGSLQIQSQNDYEIYQYIGVAFQSSGGTVDAGSLITVQLTDTGSGSTLFDRPLPLASMFGTPDLPMILPVPRMLRANSSLTATVYNGTANTVDVWLTFPGRRLFKVS